MLFNPQSCGNQCFTIWASSLMQMIDVIIWNVSPHINLVMNTKSVIKRCPRRGSKLERSFTDISLSIKVTFFPFRSYDNFSEKNYCFACSLRCHFFTIKFIIHLPKSWYLYQLLQNSSLTIRWITDVLHPEICAQKDHNKLYDTLFEQKLLKDHRLNVHHNSFRFHVQNDFFLRRLFFKRVT